MNKKWLCEIYAISRITRELETFIADEYIEAPTLEEAKQIANEDYPYLNPVEEVREIEAFAFEGKDNIHETYFIEVSDDLMMYN